jgi:adenine-specific DNA-methyltransferase
VTLIDALFLSSPYLGGESAEQVARWVRYGLLPTLDGQVPAAQAARLARLSATPFSWDGKPAVPDMLFSPVVACGLGPHACLVEDELSEEEDPIAAFLLQLLPLWATADRACAPLRGWAQASLGKRRVYILSADVWKNFEAAKARMASARGAQAAVFAKSASYMGSKAALAAQLCEIVHALETADTVVVDLMCGSGAMSGAFAKDWQTIASDAQVFSRLLARVQGGGMTRDRATRLASSVLDSARLQYEARPAWLSDHIAKEDKFIHKELTDPVLDELIVWLKNFELSLPDAERSLDRLTTARLAGQLFTALYANLFFGIRQSYEIDCLRLGIERVVDSQEREWALGALVCAASQCAFSYGGHFAQPKLDVGRPDNIRKMAAEMLQKRSLSVSHEFYSRLVSLAVESQSTPNEVRLQAGPWQTALASVKTAMAGRQVCVYLDPPYTRDEYSRYYHVLETMVQYESGPVSGKGRLPQRGHANRFASAFNSRMSSAVEDEIASIITACLTNGWSCLWSYSSSAMASMTSTLKKVGVPLTSVELFSMDHTYKIQGKHKPKRVTEYAMHIRGRVELPLVKP